MIIDLSAQAQKVNARVQDYLSKTCFGCMNSRAKPERRLWEQTTIKDALTHAVSSKETLEKLARLGGTAEDVEGETEKKAAKDVYKSAKDACAQGRNGGLWGFQFTHGLKDCQKEAVKDATPNGVYFGDVDHIPANMMDKARAALLAMPAAFAVGESVSRRGLAVALAYHTEGLKLTSADMSRVFDAVKSSVDATLRAADIAGITADKDAKNPVRWRYGLQNVAFKQATDFVTPLRIPDSAPTKAVESSDSAPTKAVESSETTDAEKLKKKAYKTIFSLFDAGLDDDTAANVARTMYERERPGSSRLKPGEIERLVRDARKYWLENGGKRGKKASEREKAAEYLEQWRFDTFHAHYITPEGVAIDTDDAAASVARALCVSKNMAADCLDVYVSGNPAKRFDGMTKRALELASAFTQSDAFSIQNFAAAARFDAYETRRFQLWMYQIMARAFCPGEKCDGMLLLTGAEGVKKSLFFDEISRRFIGIPAKAYKATDGKDSDIAMSENAIIMIEEFDKLHRKRDVAEIKEQITAASSKRRAAYARGEKTRLSRAVWAATTNETTPIPAGEGEARRYWVVRVKAKLTECLTNDLLDAMLREAAHDVQEGLASREGRAYSDEYGKVWVPTAEEERETAARNSGLKTTDAEALAIATMLDALKKCPAAKNIVLSPSQWGAIAETGEPIAYIPGVSAWKPTRCNGAAAARLIRERCRAADVARRKGGADSEGKRQNGYTLADLFYAFSIAEVAQSETTLAFA